MSITRMAVMYLGTMAVSAWVSTAALAQQGYEPVGYAVASQAAIESTEEAGVSGIHDAALAGGWDCGCGYDCGDCGCGCGDCGCGGCGDCGCGCGCCDPCCRSQGFIFGGGVSWLKPHNSTGTGSILVEEDANGIDRRVAQLDPDFDPAYNIWVGWQRCDGVGVRLRYWQFDHGYTAPITDGNLAGGVVQQGWDTYVIDAAITSSSKVGCHWDITIGAGFRYVEFEERLADIDDDGDLDLGLDSNFSGYGIVGFAEVRQQLTCNLGLFGNFGVSVVMGDDTIFVSDDGGLFAVDEHLNDVKFIYEAKVGAEYIMPICCGGYYFVRGGGEVQFWDGFGINQEDFAVPYSSTGFGGFFIDAGIHR